MDKWDVLMLAFAAWLLAGIPSLLRNDDQAVEDAAFRAAVMDPFTK